MYINKEQRWGNGSFLWENAKTLHFLQMFGQDNVCFAVATITCFFEIRATAGAVSGPPG